ncbi:MAG: two-component regulator propeller domain-containing protein [Chloroflexota bacterium]|nr:two-component regulator propeller domain-containing protein [Chloroflexota bacterium]
MQDKALHKKLVIWAVAVLTVSTVVLMACVETADTPTATPVMETVTSTVGTYPIPTLEAPTKAPFLGMFGPGVFGLGVVVHPTLTRRRPTAVPTATPTVIASQWQILPAVSLNCWESEADAPSWQQWRNVGFSDITPGGLVTDGDLLWISTRQGLFRLDVRTLECTGFPKVDQFSLTEGDSFLPTGDYLLLPDGEGGLWIGTTEGILRFSDGEWQIASQLGVAVDMHILGLRQTGSLCAETQWWRTGGIGSFCFNSTSPLTDVQQFEAPFDVMDCDQWQRVAWRGRLYSHHHDSFYNYATPAECEQIEMMQGSSPISVSPNGDETWTIEDTRLFHRQGKTIEQVDMPYRGIRVLATDPINGGVWLATEDGLVHGKVSSSTAGEPTFPNTHSVFQPFSLDQQTIPGSTYSVVVDKADQVWAISQHYCDPNRCAGREYNVLRYSDSDQTWHSISSITYDVSAIAADPARGVWIAGVDGLLYFDRAQQWTWPPLTLPDRMPTSLLVDDGGRIWLGTIQGGVWTMLPQAQSTDDMRNMQAQSLWHRFTITDGLESELIMALAQGPDGRIYAAHDAGISVLDPSDGIENGHWVTLPGSNVNPGRWVNTLVFAPPQAGGGLWVSHYYHSSLWHYQNGRWTEYHLPFEFEHYWGEPDYRRASVGRLLVDEDGTLWAGTIKGLWRWSAAGNGGKACWQTFDPNTLSMRDITALAQDSRGRIWVGGEEGIAMWDGNR